MNRRIFSVLICAIMLVGTMTVQAQQRLIVTSVTGNAEYIYNGHKYPLVRGTVLNRETVVYIPYKGSLTLADEGSDNE